MSVLDASAIIALLKNEAGHEQVTEVIERGASVCTANLAEVVTVLIRDKLSRERIETVLDELPIATFDVTRDLAMEAGFYFALTHPYGLSLADRLCLALAARERQPAITADRSWAEAGKRIGVDVRLIR